MMQSAMRLPSIAIALLCLGLGACTSKSKPAGAGTRGSSAVASAGDTGATGPEAAEDPAPAPVAEVAQELLEHVLAEDSKSAMKLLITKKDFGRPEMWDAIASNELAKKMPIDISYANTYGDSEEVIDHAIAKYAGQDLAYVRTEMPEPQVKNDRFDMYRGPLVVVADEEGSEEKIRIIGSLLHDKQEERWYVVHFEDRKPSLSPGAPRPRPEQRASGAGPEPAPEPLPDPG